jgi:hypothetical protein
VTSRTSVLVARSQRLAVVLLAVTLLLSAPTAAMAASRPGDAAGDAESRVASARRAASAQADRYMEALSAFEGIKTQAAGVETAINAGEHRAASLRRIVSKRAARAYMSAGSSLPSLLSVGDVADMMRSDKLLATANLSDSDALSLLTSQQDDLRSQREDLRTLESQQGTALAALERASKNADSALASAFRNQQGVRARLNAQAAANRATQASHASNRRTPSPIAAVVRAPSSGSSGSGSGAASPSGGSFLACVRQRESGGNYGVINPRGPWYGAYQFSASTWNVTAQHAGRMDLVGVIPSNASPADQDAMAAHLYQWQGSGPWGGSC